MEAAIERKNTIPGPCTSCRSQTTRRLGRDRICVDCEMAHLAEHLVGHPSVVPAAHRLAAYLGRPATDEEAETFTRHIIEAAEARTE